MAHTKNTTRNVAMGVGLAALAAATAGAVFLYGTEAGKKKRKQIKSWSLRMRADVMDKMEKMKDWSEDAYYRVVDEVSDKYKKVKNIDNAELAALATSLRSHWKTIRKQIEGGTKPRARRRSKTASK